MDIDQYDGGSLIVFFSDDSFLLDVELCLIEMIECLYIVVFMVFYDVNNQCIYCDFSVY